MCEHSCLLFAFKFNRTKINEKKNIKHFLLKIKSPKKLPSNKKYVKSNQRKCSIEQR